MGHVGHEAVAAELLGEDLLAERDRLGLVHLVETELLPRLRVRLDDEGRKVVIEAIGVGPDPPRIRLLEGKGEGVEHLLGAEPEELVPPRLNVRSEEHTSELQSLMRNSYAVFCLKKKTKDN